MAFRLSNAEFPERYGFLGPRTLREHDGNRRRSDARWRDQSGHGEILRNETVRGRRCPHRPRWHRCCPGAVGDPPGGNNQDPDADLGRRVQESVPERVEGRPDDHQGRGGNGALQGHVGRRAARDVLLVAALRPLRTLQAHPRGDRPENHPRVEEVRGRRRGGHHRLGHRQPHGRSQSADAGARGGQADDNGRRAGCVQRRGAPQLLSGGAHHHDPSSDPECHQARCLRRGETQVHQQRHHGRWHRLAFRREHGRWGGCRHHYKSGRHRAHAAVQPAQGREDLLGHDGLRHEDVHGGRRRGLLPGVHASVDAFRALHDHPVHGVGEAACDVRHEGDLRESRDLLASLKRGDWIASLIREARLHAGASSARCCSVKLAFIL